MRSNSAPDGLRVENKLILLYLIDKMDLPLSRSQITDFVREGEYMDYYTLQQTLADMVEGNYLDKAQDNNNTRYSITDEGITTLEYFESHIPVGIRAKINKYVKAHFDSVKRDYEVTSNYFVNSETGEFIVKCGVYEDKCALMEISVSVVSREQAKLIQANWKAHVSDLYMSILTELVSVKQDEDPLVTADDEAEEDGGVI
jgi:ABC-type long-subunit fatty acid transport system fused permease/ATPase subunit